MSDDAVDSASVTGTNPSGGSVVACAGLSSPGPVCKLVRVVTPFDEAGAVADSRRYSEIPTRGS